MPPLDEMIEALQQAGLFDDVLRLGLNGTLDPNRHTDVIPRLIGAREHFRKRFSERFRDYVEFFDERRYLDYSSIAGNLTFGFARREEFGEEHLAANPYFLRFLDSAGLTSQLMEMGVEIARRTMDIIGTLAPDEVFFEGTPFSSSEFNTIRQIGARLASAPAPALEKADREKLLALALRFAPGRHKIIGISEALKDRILEQRSRYRGMVSKDHPDAVTFFHATDYLHSQTILSNIIFGSMKTERPSIREKLFQRVVRQLIETELLETVIEIGMQYPVGIRGERL